MRIQLALNLIDIDKVVISWECQPDVGEKVSDYYFYVQNSGSKEGPWMNVNEEKIQNGFGYIDRKTQRGSIEQPIYYRILATNKKNEQVESNLINLENGPYNQYGAFIAKQQKLLYRRYKGKKVLIYPKITFGDRCPDCFDPVQNKCIRERCPNCYGTTYKGGYFNPILLFIDIEAKLINTQKTEIGKVENKQVEATAGNDLVINTDDVIIQLGSNSKRFQVSQVFPTSLNEYIVSQKMVLAEVRKDHPIHSLPVDEKYYDLEEYSVFRRSWSK